MPVLALSQPGTHAGPEIKGKENHMSRLIRLFHKDESGQDLVEYALVLIAVAAGVLTGSTTLSSDFTAWMTTLNTKINTDLGGT